MKGIRTQFNLFIRDLHELMIDVRKKHIESTLTLYGIFHRIHFKEMWYLDIANDVRWQIQKRIQPTVDTEAHLNTLPHEV